MLQSNKKVLIFLLVILILFSTYYFGYIFLNTKNKVPVSNNDIITENTDLKEITIHEVYEIASYLNVANNYYKEEENSKKVLEMLKDMKDTFYTFYYKGYAHEIVANYEEAIKNYTLALNSPDITNVEKSLVLNQLGHVHDLDGNLSYANKYYIQSEELGERLVGTLINRGRYEYRIKNYELSMEYFNLALEKSTDSFVKAEIYFNLSTIYQNKEDGIKQAVNYAILGIKSNREYPYNYLSLGISYMTIGGESLDKSVKEFKKVISLYPNSSLAYKYLGIYYYTKDDFENAVKNFEMQLEKSQIDIVLMKNQKEEVKNDALYDLAKVYALKEDGEKSMEYLNKVLNGDNINYYYSFLRDFSLENGPFSKILKTDLFKTNLENIITIYKK